MLRENALGKENRKQIAGGKANRREAWQTSTKPVAAPRSPQEDVTFMREVSCLCRPN